MSLFAIALGLSLDAFAVTVTNSVVVENLSLRHGLRMSLFFGLFQAAMPFVGWLAGSLFAKAIEGVDHWIAFGLLAFIGIRMIVESLRKKDAPAEGCKDDDAKDCRNLPTLLLMSFATSIDALAVGLSFAFIGVGVAIPVVVIGAVTFAVCLAGYFIGKRIRNAINVRLELFGGIILIGIGIKILVDHLISA